MTTAEIFSWCACVSIGALAWLAAGVPGVLCMVVGMIVSQIDVGWIDAQFAKAAEVVVGQARPPEPPKPRRTARRRKLPPNVVPLFPTQRAS